MCPNAIHSHVLSPGLALINKTSAPKVRKTAASPYMHVGFVRQPHGLTGCHAERFIELRDIDKRAIHAPLRWRVDIAEQAAAQEFFAAFVEPAERVAEKEAL